MDAESLVRVPGSGDTLWIFQDLVEIKIAGEENGDAYSVLEDWPAPTYAPLLHIHVEADEIVTILGGTFTFMTEENELELSVGDAVFIPKGTPHAFRNTGDESGHRSVTFVPAGPERLWAEVGMPAEDLTTPPANPTDLSGFLDAAKRHGLEVVGAHRPSPP